MIKEAPITSCSHLLVNVQPKILQIQTRQEVRSKRKEVAEYSLFLWKTNRHTGLNDFPEMAVAELWIDCRPLENIFCMKPHRLNITQRGKKRRLCCHLLEPEDEECEGKEQILFACPVDVIICGWEDNEMFSLLCARRTGVCQVELDS